MFTLNEKTTSRVATLLNNLSMSQQRIRLVYGDTNTGKDWLEECDVIGTIGRSTGTKQMPLLIRNSRSTGGGSILDHCILKIVDVKSERILYQHEKYITPSFEIEISEPDTLSRYRVISDNKLLATFSEYDEAQKYIDFMLCKRMSK